MTRKIMLLSDFPAMQKEAVQYSVELAKRMNSKLVFLFLMSFEASGDGSNEMEAIVDMGARAVDVLKQLSETYQNIGLTIETAVRIGDPRSELVKFLAESGIFQTIVWGGRPEHVHQKSHWLARINQTVKCSIVVPVKKIQTGNRKVKFFR